MHSVQSSLTMEGFSKGGVLPFWQSPLISVQSLLRFGPDEMGDVLDRDPHAFLIKSDIGSVSFFVHGTQKYTIGMVDSWSPQEPSSRQPLQPIMYCFFPDNLGQVFHRNFGFRASFVEPSGNHRPPVRESFLALSLSLVSVPHRKRRTISRCGSCP